MNSLCALGFLSITITNPKQLPAIKDLHIIEIGVYGIIERKILVSLLPRIFNNFFICIILDCWIINSKYTIPDEHPEDYKKSLVFNAQQTTKIHNMRKRTFLEKFGMNSPAANWDRSLQEQQKLKYLIEDLEYKCELDWNKGSEYFKPYNPT